MKAKDKKLLTYGGVGLVAVVALYLLTRRSDAAGGGGGDGGGGGGSIFDVTRESILQRITDQISTGTSQIITGVAEVPGTLVIDVPKKMVLSSEERTSNVIFGGVAKENVPGFWATGGGGKVFAQPVTYQQFIQEQPIALRVAAAAGNIITGGAAAEYGKYAGEETKKAVVATGRSGTQWDIDYSKLNPLAQTFVALGNVLTVPFGGGGASGWGAGMVGGTDTKKAEIIKRIFTR